MFGFVKKVGVHEQPPLCGPNTGGSDAKNQETQTWIHGFGGFWSALQGFELRGLGLLFQGGLAV